MSRKARIKQALDKANELYSKRHKSLHDYEDWWQAELILSQVLTRG